MNHPLYVCPMPAASGTHPNPPTSSFIFTGWSMLAILEGRKTQTRRLIRCANSLICGEPFPRKRWVDLDLPRAWVDPGPSPAGNEGPYLKVRDTGWGGVEDRPILRCYPRLWKGDRVRVRESWRTEERSVMRDEVGVDGILYRADDAFVPIENSMEAAKRWIVAHDNGRHQHHGKWRSPIHLPRWASRLYLRIIAVRPERLQDIGVGDAAAEGCTGFDPEPEDEGGTIYSWKGRSSAPCPRAHFRHLWEQLHGRRGHTWETNPWVWVYTFEVAQRRTEL